MTITNNNNKTDAEIPRGLGLPSSREELVSFLTEIEQRIVQSKNANMHSIVAVDQLLRHPAAAELFDEELKGQLRDIWIKLKSSGMQLVDPPFLFGVPKDLGLQADD